jgi:hypothetical protein
MATALLLASSNDATGAQILEGVRMARQASAQAV